MFSRADIDDLDRLMPLCEKHFYEAKMGARGYSFDLHTATETLATWLKAPNIYVGFGQKSIIAFAWITSPFNRADRYWSELLWYASTAKEMKLIFEHFMEKQAYSSDIRVGVPLRGSLSRFLRRRGFVLTEQSFLRHNK